MSWVALVHAWRLARINDKEFIERAAQFGRTDQARRMVAADLETP